MRAKPLIFGENKYATLKRLGFDAGFKFMIKQMFTDLSREFPQFSLPSPQNQR
jgi:hypothetical protein